jgi:hypothetical protein
MAYYVYRFIDVTNEIIYVGKTKNIETRINRQHFTINGHLPQDCYDDTLKVEYAILNSKVEMDIYELYYINKCLPKYNVSDKCEEDFNLCLPELNWQTYKEFDKVVVSKEDQQRLEHIKVDRDKLLKSLYCAEMEMTRVYHRTIRWLYDIEDFADNSIANKYNADELRKLSNSIKEEISFLEKYEEYPVEKRSFKDWENKRTCV